MPQPANPTEFARRYCRHFTRLLAGLCWLLLLGSPSPVQATDTATIKSRLLSDLAETPPDAAVAQGYQTTLRADGTWADVDLASTAQTNWPGRIHLDRVRTMARAHAFTGSLQGSPDLRAAIFLAYDTFVARDPKSTNWWYQGIGTPQALGEILLLMEAEVSSARLNAGLTLIARSYVPRSVNSGTNTGSNRVEQAYGTLLRGLLTNDAALTAEAYLAMGDTVLVNSASTFAEGIQPDGSFQQHGAQLYDGGYGYGYAQSLLKFASWGAGTALGFDARQLRVLVDYVLDGPQWLIRGDTMDYTATGRALSRAGGGALAPGYLGTLDDATVVAGSYRVAEIAAFRARVADAASTGTASTSLALTGNRQFWSSDIMVHHRPGFLVGVKTSSTRTLQPETGNGENLKGLHLADGVTLIQRTGNEYDGIMPCWDWRHLPGTTTQRAEYALKPSADWGVRGTSTHAGGASDGRDGAASFAYSRLGVAAKKSWFLLGDVMIALGANITAPTAAQPVVTSLDQCRASGAVTYSDGPTVSTANVPTATTLAQPAWVHHNGVGYFFLSPTAAVDLDLSSRSGTWQSINTSQSTTVVTSSVFSLQINHGPAPAGATYAYLVAPGLAASGMAGFPIANWEVLRNDGTAQAVKDQATGTTAATFWSTATVDGITCSATANLLVKREPRFLEVTLADPTQTNTGSITVTLDAPVAGMLSADTGVVVEQLAPTVRLRFNVAKSRGRSFRARFHTRPNAFETQSFEPVEDTYVHDASPTSNFGSATSLVSKLITSSSGWTRESFLRFDLSSLQGRVPSVARLRLTTLSSQTPGLYGVQALAPASWSETSATWNNRPQPIAGRTALWSPVVGERISVDVLPSVLARTSTVLDLGLFTHAPTSDGFTSYASRENATTSSRPVLEMLFPRPELSLWREENFGAAVANAAISGDEADPDGDGFPNLLEFVLGGNPQRASEADVQPHLSLGGGQAEFTYRRSQASADIVVTAEMSTDLVTWEPLVPGMNEVRAATQHDEPIRGVDSLTLSMPLQVASHRYFRVRVQQP